MRYEQALALDMLGRHGEPGQRPADRERAAALFERLGVQDLTSPEALAGQRLRPRPVDPPVAVNRLRRPSAPCGARYRGRGEPPGWRTAKTTLAAVLSYVLAVWLLGDQVPPLLAPLTALLVAQLTIFETVKSGIERVGSVVAGVLVAVAAVQLRRADLVEPWHRHLRLAGHRAGPAAGRPHPRGPDQRHAGAGRGRPDRDRRPRPGWWRR